MIETSWAFTLIVAEMVMFWVVLYYLWQYELRKGIRSDYREYIMIGIIFTLVEIMLFSYIGYGSRICFHSLVFFYLLIAAYIDHKQKIVYRIGSIGLITLAVYLYFSSLPSSRAVVMEEIPVMLLFCSIALMMGAFSLIGWGDTLTYIGVFFWLGSWKSSWMTIEVMAVYMLLSNLIFFAFNIKNVDWKNWKLKEEAPFLPSMVTGVILIKILMCLI